MNTKPKKAVSLDLTTALDEHYKFVSFRGPKVSYELHQ